MEAKKVQFGSDAWFSALQKTLSDLVKKNGSALDGQSVRICEVITGAPPELGHVRADGTKAWHIVIEGRNAFAALGEIDDADFGSVSDFNAILRMARWVYSDDEADMAAVAAHREDLEKAGKFTATGQRPEFSPAMGMMLRDLHNTLARMTA